MNFSFTPFSPIFLTIWPVNFYYYGLMYAFSFLIAYVILRKSIMLKWVSENDFEKLFYWTIFMWLVWWRLWHILFYDFEYFSQNLIEVFYIWNGWMASHWWFIWALIWIYIFKPKIPLLKLLDLLIYPVPIWLALWRLWNLINWEIYGKATNVPWCMEFADTICRHPTQIYAILKNLTIFAVLYYLNKKLIENWKLKVKSYLQPWILFSSFLILYWFLRIVVEFFKEDFIWNNYIELITTGQVLSAIMVVIWVLILHRRG